MRVRFPLPALYPLLYIIYLFILSILLSYYNYKLLNTLIDLDSNKYIISNKIEYTIQKISYIFFFSNKRSESKNTQKSQ